MMRLPSGDQIGVELCRPASKVRWVSDPRGSITQTSPPLPSWRCTAIRFVSGDTSTPRYAPEGPTLSRICPVRLTHDNCHSPRSELGPPPADAELRLKKNATTPSGDSERWLRPALESYRTSSATRTGSPDSESLLALKRCA